MNRLHYIALLPLLALGFVFAGCDSDGDDGVTIEERLLGTWEVSEASVRVSTLLGTIPVPVLEASDSEAVSISFTSGDRFSFTLMGPIEVEIPTVGPFVILQADQVTTNSGTFEVVENDEQIRFTTTEINGQTIPTPGSADVTFELRGDNALVLIADNTPEGQEVIDFLFGDALPKELLSSIEGGEATFNRAN